MIRSHSTRLLVGDIGFTGDIDGPGQRLVIYLKGCNLCCPWCALPETISPLPELLFYANRVSRPEQAIQACPHGAIWLQGGRLVRERGICAPCSGRECLQSGLTAFEWVGKEMTVDALVKLAIRYRPFFAQVGGVTVGGGEPTCQYDGVRQLLMALQNQDIHTVMETNGTHSKLAALFPYIAFLLIDLKHPDDAVCRTATRQGNTTILENIQARFQQQQPFRVRIPLVPGFNDDPATLDAFGRVLSGIGRLEVEVLPFHRRGETKWEAMGQPMPVGMTLPPEPRQVERACARLAQFGLTMVSD